MVMVSFHIMTTAHIMSIGLEMNGNEIVPGEPGKAVNKMRATL